MCIVTNGCLAGTSGLSMRDRLGIKDSEASVDEKQKQREKTT